MLNEQVHIQFRCASRRTVAHTTRSFTCQTSV